MTEKSRTTRLGGTRESHLYEVTLEWTFGVPYDALVATALATNACDEIDLLHLGRTIFRDLVRLIRGDLTSVHVPFRLPFRGEHSRDGGAS